MWAYFDAVGPLIGRPWPITYRLSDDDRVARLRRMGVRHFSSLSYAHKPGNAQFLNDWTRQFADRTPDTLWSGTFFPDPVVTAKLERALGIRLREKVEEMHPGTRGAQGGVTIGDLIRMQKK